MVISTLADQITQFITTTPFALQLLLVGVVVVPLCAVLAMVLLRSVDIMGALWIRMRYTWRMQMNEFFSSQQRNKSNGES